MGLSIGNIVKGTTTGCYTFGMIGEITNINGTDVEVRIFYSKNEKNIGRIIVFSPYELQVLDEGDNTTAVCPVIENRKKQIEKENEALRLEPEATKPLDTKLAARYNAGKPPLSMVESSLIEEVAKVLDFGSRKYSRNNWRKGLKFNSVIDSILRHLLAFKDGQDLDPESGLSHLGHIGCNLQFLIYYMKNNKDMDDRLD